MAIQLVGGASGVAVDTDTNKNILIRRGPAHYGAAGGAFKVAGATSAVVAAALAASTTLAALRLGTGATVKAYITRLRLAISPATVGASAGVPGALVWQRFTTATPSGGTARTVGRMDATTGSGSAVSDVRDSNAALTVTGLSFTDIIASGPIPNFTTGGAYEWVIDMDEDEFPVLAAGDGIALRTLVAGPATMTWCYSYTMHWLER